MSKIFTFLILLISSSISLCADFEKSINFVLKHEGLYSNNKNDKGGSTKFGISLRYLEALYKKDPISMQGLDLNKDGVINDYDIYNMRKSEAIEIYRKYWWDAYGYGKISNQKLATKLFDISINIGQRRAHLLFKKALRKNIFFKKVSLDEKLEYNTIVNVNRLCYFVCDSLIKDFELEVIEFYNDLVDKNPRYKTFIKGWINRVQDLDY